MRALGYFVISRLTYSASSVSIQLKENMDFMACPAK